jgi:hypothetical protein
LTEIYLGFTFLISSCHTSDTEQVEGGRPAPSSLDLAFFRLHNACLLKLSTWWEGAVDRTRFDRGLEEVSASLRVLLEEDIAAMETAPPAPVCQAFPSSAVHFDRDLPMSHLFSPRNIEI